MNNDQNNTTPTETTNTTEEQPTVAESPQNNENKRADLLARLKQKPVFIAIIPVLLLILIAGVGLVITVNKSPIVSTSNQSQLTKQKQLIGAEVVVVDGIAEIVNTEGSRALKVGDKILEGETISTTENGRVVVNIDDGSAVRINSSSKITFARLKADDIVIVNNTGEVYTRVVKSDRLFTVTVDDESYTALGTAYKTTNRDGAKGVEVYQSEVAVKKADQKIAEGKRFYQANTVAELDKKITDIPLDQLQKDDFLKWNLNHDKNASEFKDKLGYLKTLEETPAPVVTLPPAPKPATTAGISLSGVKTESGVKLTWTVSGISVTKGFKVVKGLGANPVFGSSDAAYVSDSAARNYSWTIKDGKTYHFRVCTYTGESCTNYSNDVTVTAPLYQVAEPTGSVSLQYAGSAGQNNLKWVLSGTAPHGYKLVWSSSPNPTYPANDKAFYDGNATTGAIGASLANTYYARLCVLTSHAECYSYSNELTVTIP